MLPLTLRLLGLAVWCDRASDWPSMRSALRGQAELPSTPAAKPVAAMLSSAERRRASQTTAMALHVAHEAVLASAVDASSLASVFASPHGDLEITDQQCDTLARDPTLLSPTRFIHSVHNAVSGAWGIAVGNTLPSIAVAAHRHSFTLGLLEAAMVAARTRSPVLLVAYESAPMGATAQLVDSQSALAVAMVLAPQVDSAAAQTTLTLTWRQADQGACIDAHAAPLSKVGRALQVNALADALPVLEALAGVRALRRVELTTGPSTALVLEVAGAV
jgi:hypothetical protein